MAAEPERLPESDREGDLPHPRETEALVGHEAAEHVLAECLSTGRVAHAWLIGGPKGVGKATLAYRFARAALAGRPVNPATDHPLAVPAEDPVFRHVAAGTHSDILVLRRPYDEKAKRFKSQLPVDEVRRIYPFFGRHAGQGGFRVCIVDAADDLNANAANALLKLVEEPPAKSIFVLVAHAPARLLATLRSRCRHLHLKPVEEGLVAALLAREAGELADAERRALARLAEGCPGRALALARGAGLALYQEVSRLFMELPEIDPNALYALAERLARPAEEQAYERALSFLKGWVGRLARHAAQAPAPAIFAGEEKALARLGLPAHREGWAKLWEESETLTRQAEGLSLDRKQVILSLVFAAARTAQGAPAWP